MGWNGSEMAFGRCQPEIKPMPKPCKKNRNLLFCLIPIIAVCFAWVLILLFQDHPNQKKLRQDSGLKLIKTKKPAISKKPQKNERILGTVENALAKIESQDKVRLKYAAELAARYKNPGQMPFEHGVEQLMSWLFTTVPGNCPMPIPPISDEDRKNLAAILIDKIDIKDTDDDSARFCKETVALAKKEMINFIKEGGTPDQFMQHYFNELQHAFHLRQDAEDQLKEICSESPDLAEEYVQRVNEILQAQGITPIAIER